MCLRKLGLLLLIASLTAVAQKKTVPNKTSSASPNSTWKLVSIKVTGSQRYTPEEILGTCGLQVGQPENEEDFKKATDQFGQTGLFSNASYSYTYSSEGVKLEFQLADNDQLVAAQFDNFVWLS